jgi:lipopolysaccharide transport system permease protein
MTSIINAYFRDMEYIVGVAISMLFWMTPIIYPLEMVPEAYRIYLVFNPLTYLVTAWRDIFMANTINWININISLITSLFFFLLGALIFQKFGKKLDEVL